MALRSSPPVITFLGGGSTGQTAADFLDAVDQNRVPEISQATVYAIVSTSDSGSRTGELRMMYGIPAIGDIRRSVAALSANQRAAKILEHRFGPWATPNDVNRLGRSLVRCLIAGPSRVEPERIREIVNGTHTRSIDIYHRSAKRLEGMAYGHALLTELVLLHGGDVQAATAEANELFATRGQVIPVSNILHHVRMHDGDLVIDGEKAIDTHAIEHPNAVAISLYSIEQAQPLVSISPAAEQAIRSSDTVVVGPGSVYTSIVPSLLPIGMPEALRSVPERLIVANLINEPTETRGWTGKRYVEETEKYAGCAFTKVVYNIDTEKLPKGMAVIFSREDLAVLGGRQVVGAPLVKKQRRHFSRFDPIKNRATIVHDMTAAAPLVASR